MSSSPGGAEIFEVPCVAFDVETREEAEALSRAGADFIAIRLAADATAGGNARARGRDRRGACRVRDGRLKDPPCATPRSCQARRGDRCIALLGAQRAGAETSSWVGAATAAEPAPAAKKKAEPKPRARQDHQDRAGHADDPAGDRAACCAQLPGRACRARPHLPLQAARRRRPRRPAPRLANAPPAAPGPAASEYAKTPAPERGCALRSLRPGQVPDGAAAGREGRRAAAIRRRTHWSAASTRKAMARPRTPASPPSGTPAAPSSAIPRPCSRWA